MNIPIQSLNNILFLIAIIFPAGLGANLLMPFQKKFKSSISSGLAGMVIGYFIIIILVLYIKPKLILTFNTTQVIMFPIALLSGIFCIFIEYLIGIFQLYCITGKLITKMAIHSSYSGYQQVTIWDVLMILTFVICEELILRQTPFLLFSQTFKLQSWLTILFCSIIYAINHITFGLQVLPQKTISGLIYTLLYYISGNSIIIVVIGHFTQNISLLFMSRTGRENES